MTDSETLRAMLKERGIKYKTRDALGACETSWCGYTAYQLTPESKLIMHPTPEQAIAATVGVGTCKLVDNDSGPDMHCTACGGGVDDEYRYFMDIWGYSRCPHCGARIIEEETE